VGKESKGACVCVSHTGLCRRYNQLFRFLLRLRRVQMDLERVWIQQKQWKARPQQSREDKIVERLSCLLRLEMAFFADSLMHYIQVRAADALFCLSHLLFTLSVQDVIDVEFEEMCSSLADAKGGTDVEEVVNLLEAFLQKLAIYCCFSHILPIHTSLGQIFTLVLLQLMCRVGEQVFTTWSLQAQAFSNHLTSSGPPSAGQAALLQSFLDRFHKHRNFVVSILTGLLGHKGRSVSSIHFSGLLLRFQSFSSSSSPFLSSSFS